MHPEIFRIPWINLPLHSYGLMLVIGLLLAMELAKFLARRSGFNADQFANAGILALVSGIIGARILFVIQNNAEFRRPDHTFWTNAWDAINITSGGLVYYGGFLLAFPTLVFYAIKSKIPVRRGMDIMAPCLMIGLAFGRVGCFLNGCCGGSSCALPWAVSFPYGSETFSMQFDDKATQNELLRTLPTELIGVTDSGKLALRTPETPTQRSAALSVRSLPVHPTQLYSVLTAGLIAMATYFFFTLNLSPGRGFALMMMLEGMSRGLLETLRVEPHVGDLTLSEWIGLAVFLGGAALWFACRRPPRPTEPEFPPTLAAA